MQSDSAAIQEGDVVFIAQGVWKRFRAPVEIVQTRQKEEVRSCLEKIERATDRGLHAAGFVAYEAAAGLDGALAVHAPGALPLLWFGLYSRSEAMADLPVEDTLWPREYWRPDVCREKYEAAFNTIREYLAAGDIYQANYTFPLSTHFSSPPFDWFLGLVKQQGAGHFSFLDMGDFKILSISPELFFRRDGDRIETRPMKGTALRGRWPEEDRRLARELFLSEKERAENVMIVDLLRNDLGRVAETGSVEVTELFQVEQYPTVWQMTSTIRAKTSASLPELFTALFPSGSVTGAPKIRAMEIIRELEPYPRGVYCGSVGWCGPGRRAEFNVAIRTLTLETATGQAHYSVGSGITWESSRDNEYEECLLKAAILSQENQRFDLLESLRFEGNYFLLEEHLDRLRESAAYFGIPVDMAAIQEALLVEAAGLPSAPHKVRLRVMLDGTVSIEAAPIAPPGRLRVGFAAEPVDERNVFLYHKTTSREIYARARALRPDCDNVLLWNRQGEMTESTIANIVVKRDGRWHTPPVSCGLLPGVMRASLLQRGIIQETVLSQDDVRTAECIRLINSVRGWIDVELIP